MNIFQYISDKTLAHLLLMDNKEFINVIKRHYEKQREEINVKKAPLTALIQKIETIEQTQRSTGVEYIANIKKQLSDVWTDSSLPSQYFLSTKVIEKLQKLEFKILEANLETSTIRKEKSYIAHILFNEVRIENTYRVGISKIYADIKNITTINDISNIKKQLHQVQKDCIPESRYFLAAQVIEEELTALELMISKSPDDEKNILEINRLKISQKLKNETKPADLHVVLNYLFSEIYILTEHGIKNNPPTLSKIEKQYIKDCITTLLNPKFNIYTLQAADRENKRANDEKNNQIGCFLENIRDCIQDSNDDETKEIYLLFLKFLSNTERYYKITPLFIMSLTNTLGKFSLEEIFEYYLKPNTGLFFTMYYQNSEDHTTVENLEKHSSFFIDLLNNLANKEAENKFSKDRSAMVLGFLDHMIPWENLDVFQISRLGEYDETSFMQNYVNLCLKLNSNDDISKLKIVTQAFNEQIQLIENPNNEQIALIDTSAPTPESKTFSIQAFENIVKAQDSSILTYYEKLEPNVRYELEKKLSQTLERCSTDDLQKLKQSANPNTTVIGFLLNKIDVKKDTPTVELLNSLQLDFGRTGTIIQNTLASITKYIHQKATTQSLEPSDEANNLIKLFSFLKIKPGDFDNFQTTLLNFLNLHIFPLGDNLLILIDQLKNKEMTENEIREALVQSMAINLNLDMDKDTEKTLKKTLPPSMLKKEQLIQFLEIFDQFKNDYHFKNLLEQMQKKEYKDLVSLNLQLNYLTSVILDASQVDLSTLSTVATLNECWQQQEDLIHDAATKIRKLLEKLPDILETKKNELQDSITILKYDAGQTLSNNAKSRKKELHIDQTPLRMPTLINSELMDLLNEIENPNTEISLDFIDGCFFYIKNYMNLTTTIKQEAEKRLADTPEHRYLFDKQYNQKKDSIIRALNVWIEKAINKYEANHLIDTLMIRALKINTDDTPDKIQKQIDNKINPIIEDLKQSLNNKIMASVMDKIPSLYKEYLTEITANRTSSNEKINYILASNQLLNKEVKSTIEFLIMKKCSAAKRMLTEACYIRTIERFKIEFPLVDNENYKKAIVSIDETQKQLTTSLSTLVNEQIPFQNTTVAYNSIIEKKKEEINSKAKNLKISILSDELKHFNTKFPEYGNVYSWILTTKQRLKIIVDSLCELLKNDEKAIKQIKETQNNIVGNVEKMSIKFIKASLRSFRPSTLHGWAKANEWFVREKQKLNNIVNPLYELLKEHQDPEAIAEIKQIQITEIKMLEKFCIDVIQNRLNDFEPKLPQEVEVTRWIAKKQQKLEKIVNSLCEFLKNDEQAIKKVRETQTTKIKILEKIGIDAIQNRLNHFEPKLPQEVEVTQWLVQEQQKLEKIVNSLCEFLKNDKEAIKKVRETQKSLIETIEKMGIKRVKTTLKHFIPNARPEWTEIDKWLLTEKQKLEQIANPLFELLPTRQETIDKIKQIQITQIKMLEDVCIKITEDALNNFDPTFPKGADVTQWSLTEKQTLEKIVNTLCGLLEENDVIKVRRTQKSLIETIEDIATFEQKKARMEKHKKERAPSLSSSSESEDDIKPSKAPNKKVPPKNKHKKESLESDEETPDKQPNETKSQKYDRTRSISVVGHKHNRKKNQSDNETKPEKYDRIRSHSIEEHNKKTPDIESSSGSDEETLKDQQSKTPVIKSNMRVSPVSMFDSKQKPEESPASKSTQNMNKSQ